MKRYLIILFVTLMPFIACENKNGKKIVVETLINPILNMEVIEIPLLGKVVWINGEAEIKRKNSNEYTKITLDTTIDEDDILWLKKESIVKIQFEDGSYVVNEPVGEESFFTFESIKYTNMPQ